MQRGKTEEGRTMNPLTQSKKTTILPLLIALTLVCFGLSPMAQAVTPPPDGAYPGENTAEGDDALFSLTTGRDNTAIGDDALKHNTTGNLNTAIGANALKKNRTGGGNTASGASALVANTTGLDNTANGYGALFSNTAGIANTANGVFALLFNTTGNFNTAIGVDSLFNNTTGNFNTASGGALGSNTTGNDNTADGFDALAVNETGSNNTAVGFLALSNNRLGNNNIALGALAGGSLTTGSNNIDIGNAGVTGESAKIRIGTTGAQNNTFIAGISGVTVAGGVGVVIDSNGQLGTTTSSARFKQDIQAMGEASDALLALKPVTFRYKRQIDPDGIPQFGLVAEEVEKVNPALVARDAKGEVYTVRYEAVNAMLLNEFLKAHRKAQQQEATITQLKKDFGATIAQLTARLEEQAAQIQKVSAQLEASKSAPQVVLNNQ
jgi:Chaperone of endosialidase